MQEKVKKFSGLLFLHKPKGISSFGVIEGLQKKIASHWGLKKRDLPKMGHGGTLDPFATGLLVIALGQTTQVLRYFLGSKKRYQATLFWGKKTESGDLDTSACQSTDRPIPTAEQIRNRLPSFVGCEYWQTPPMYSAKKQDGIPLYELARQGQTVERAPTLQKIFSAQLLRHTPPFTEIEVECSAGTYIRTFAEDLALRLEHLAHLTELTRLSSGSFHLSQSAPLEQVLLDVCQSQFFDGTAPYFCPFDQALDGLNPLHAPLQVNEAQITDLLHGKQIRMNGWLKSLLQQNGLESQAPDLLVLKKGHRLVAALSKNPSPSSKSQSEFNEYTLDRVFFSQSVD